MPDPKKQTPAEKARASLMRAMARYSKACPTPKIEEKDIKVEPRLCGAQRTSFARGANMFLNYCVMGQDIPCLVVPIDNVDALVERLAQRIWAERRLTEKLPTWAKAGALAQRPIRVQVWTVVRQLTELPRS